MRTNEAFCQAVTAELERQERSRAWLARKLGYHQNTMYLRFKGGERVWDLDECDRIAAALDVPIAALLPRLDSNQQPVVYGNAA